ncbi:MAG: tRNA uridine-5-carboxymethylaminomethyl(34) synthesis GTPase MnmE, partial [bacterium]
MPDTICAISTPIGRGGIGIVRLSGERSLPIAKKIFRTKARFISHRLLYGKIYDPSSNSFIDEALLCYMKAPRTYTREDVVEINLHSSFNVLSDVLSLVLKEGARL